ncbi:hypothetical protein HYX19_01970 [Candidatus Woesearchaeota archaeon]|nr:hypothetical protein [Candidatus Woesearchaeota archaeon]
MTSKKILTGVIAASIIFFGRNSFESEIEEQVNNPTVNCQQDENNLETGFEIFNLKGQILKLYKTIGKLNINNCKTKQTTLYEENLDSFFIYEANAKIEKEYHIDYVNYQVEGKLIGIIDRMRNLEVLEGNEFKYIGRFIGGILKENPQEATIYERLDSSLNDMILSYPSYGGQIYLNTEKTYYTIDLLGNIRNALLGKNQFIGHYAFSLYTKSNVKILRIKSNDGKRYGSFQKVQEASYLPKEEPEFAYFNNTDTPINGLPSIFAVRNNFGDGQVFELMDFKDNEPILKTTHYKISADGIIGDDNELITMPNGSRRPKPKLQIKFGVLYYPFTNQKYTNNYVGRIDIEELNYFFRLWR